MTKTARVKLGLRQLFHAACVAHDAIGGPSLGGAALVVVRERPELQQAVERLEREAEERQRELDAVECGQRESQLGLQAAERGQQRLLELINTLTRERDEARSESAVHEDSWKTELAGALTLRQRIRELESDVRLYVRDCGHVARQRDAALAQVSEAKFQLRAVLSGVADGVDGVPHELDKADLAALLTAVQAYALDLEARIELAGILPRAPLEATAGSSEGLDGEDLDTGEQLGQVEDLNDAGEGEREPELAPLPTNTVRPDENG